MLVEVRGIMLVEGERDHLGIGLREFRLLGVERSDLCRYAV